MTTEMHMTIDERVDSKRAIGTIVAAFAADPVLRWMYPDPARYLEQFPELVELLGREAFAAGTTDAAPKYAGAALWVPPGAPSDDEAAGELFERHVEAERLSAVFEFLAQLGEYHPTEPVWYLPFIGVDPYRQGQGHGSALLERGLARADRDGVAAYLEASSPRNRALYERHGFEVVGEIQAADSPPLWPMLRRPRK